MKDSEYEASRVPRPKDAMVISNLAQAVSRNQQRRHATGWYFV